MKKRVVVLSGLALILLLSAAVVFAQGTQNKEGSFKHGEFFGKGHRMLGDGFSPKFNGEFGMPRNIDRKETKATIIENLGLTKNATEEEIKEAFKQKREEMRLQQLQEVKEKLGLSSDATEGDRLKALQDWREENKVLIGFGKYRAEGHLNGFAKTFK